MNVSSLALPPSLSKFVSQRVSQSVTQFGRPSEEKVPRTRVTQFGRPSEKKVPRTRVTQLAVARDLRGQGAADPGPPMNKLPARFHTVTTMVVSGMHSVLMMHACGS